MAGAGGGQLKAVARRGLGPLFQPAADLRHWAVIWRCTAARTCPGIAPG